MLGKASLALALAATVLLAEIPVAKPPKPKTPKEVEAIQAMFAARTGGADAIIAAADNLMVKFADTEFKPLALQFKAMSYQQKGDQVNVIITCEELLKIDPKNFDAMLMLAEAITQGTRENDLDREEKLTRAEKYAHDAMAVIPDSPKPSAQVTDPQWESARKDYMARAHQSLAMAAMIRKKYDVAITEFKTALETGSAPDSATMVRLGAAYNAAGKPDEAVPLLEKVMAMPDAPVQIKQVAQAEKARAAQMKAQKK